MKRSNGYGMMVGAGAFGGAAIALGIATFSAISGGSATADVPATGVADAAPRAAADGSFDLLASPARPGATQAVQWEDLELATELAPFEENRVWTGERYRLPGENVVVQVEALQPQREVEPAPAFEVLGTAASAGSGLAVIRVGTGTPQLVSLGQRVEGYEVAAIDNGRVTLRNADRSLSLSVASAAPTGTPQAARNARPGQIARPQGNANARGNANGAARQGAAPAGPAGAAQANPAARGPAIQQLEQLGQMFGPGAQVQVNGNQVTITGPNGQQRMIFGAPGAGAPTEMRIREIAPVPRGQ